MDGSIAESIRDLCKNNGSRRSAVLSGKVFATETFQPDSPDKSDPGLAGCVDDPSYIAEFADRE